MALAARPVTAAKGRVLVKSPIGSINIAWLAALTVSLTTLAPVHADDASAFREVETKYIFGFTEGSSIGLEGEKELSVETVVNFKKRDGRYTATKTKLEFEHTPTQYVQIEFGAMFASHNIMDVTGLDNRNSFQFAGLFGEIRHVVVGRGPGSPIGITVVVEPAWGRLSGNSGERENSFELETKLLVDAELVANRLYWAANFIYEPEWVRTLEGEIERESTLGLSSALALRLIEPLLVGVELDYYRKYEGIAFKTFTGDALFVGPTLYYKIARKAFITAALAAQIYGHAVGEVGALNLDSFARYRAKVKAAVEF
jgi:hypothetical protein